MSDPIPIDGTRAIEVILSRQFNTYPMGDKYREISQKFDIDFSAIIELMDHLPIFLNGERHKQNRRMLAEIYARSRKEQEKGIDLALARIQKTLGTRDGDVDVLSEISKPLWDATGTAIAGETALDVDPHLIADLPDLFYPLFGIRRRQSLNDRLADALNAVPDNNRKDFLTTVSVLVLGVRPLMHSLAFSVYSLAQDNIGKKLSDINYPPTFSDSALRFVDRMAMDDVEVAGCPFKAGNRLRCITFDESHSEDHNAKYLFGAGKHICPGRPISLYIWKNFTQKLAQLDKRISPGTLTVAQQEPFRMANECTISLSN